MNLMSIGALLFLIFFCFRYHEIFIYMSILHISSFSFSLKLFFFIIFFTKVTLTVLTGHGQRFKEDLTEASISTARTLNIKMEICLAAQ